MKIIVGLGNPGPRYRDTRHNVGFRAADRAAERLGAAFSKEKHRALVAEARQRGGRLVLMKPLTYMNRSGEAVGEAARYMLEGLEDLLVIVDEVQLPLGRLRLRKEGSAGGHNGLKSLIQHLGTESFPRLRIGVGRQSDERVLRDHVLGRFSKEEGPEAESAVDRAAAAALCWAAEGVETAMNEYNRS